MTSEERHAARYERRHAKREAKRREVQHRYGDYENVIKRTSLAKAARESAKGVSNKSSVKHYMLRMLINNNRTYHRLRKEKDVRKGFICFTLVDRGKLRHIMSVHFSERVPQKSYNRNTLVPMLTRSIIYDNGASLKGKGTSFALRRITLMLRRHYHKYGNKGYVLVLDFKDFFGNIDHEIAKDIVRKSFDDARMVWLGCQFIDAYYEHNVKEAKRNGRDPAEVEHKGLGLGSETNQTIAISYPNSIDHFIKEVLRIKGYERYMDDLILISDSKEKLQDALKEIRKRCSKLKIEINENKTYVTKLSHGFTFLKTQFFLTDTGKILRKPVRSSFTRERRKLKKQAALLRVGEMTPDEVTSSYMSWRGSVIRKQARRSIYNMDRLYESLIGGNDYG